MNNDSRGSKASFIEVQPDVREDNCEGEADTQKPTTKEQTFDKKAVSGSDRIVRDGVAHLRPPPPPLPCPPLRIRDWRCIDCQKINETKKVFSQKVFTLTNNVCPVDNQHTVISENTSSVALAIAGLIKSKDFESALDRIKANPKCLTWKDPSWFNCTLLHHAAMKEDDCGLMASIFEIYSRDIFKELPELAKDIINELDSCGYSALYNAIWDEKESVIDVLLRHGAIIDTKAIERAKRSSKKIKDKIAKEILSRAKNVDETIYAVEFFKECRIDNGEIVDTIVKKLDLFQPFSGES